MKGYDYRLIYFSPIYAIDSSGGSDFAMEDDDL